MRGVGKGWRHSSGGRNADSLVEAGIQGEKAEPSSLCLLPKKLDNDTVVWLERYTRTGYSYYGYAPDRPASDISPSADRHFQSHGG